MPKLIKWFRKYWFIFPIVGTIISVIAGSAIAWNELNNKVDNVDKRITYIEQTQLKQAEIEAKMFDFIMDLWKIEPEQRDKWKVYPTEPKLNENGDTLSCRWLEFEGFERLIHWKISIFKLQDSTITKAWVDTLYVHKE